ncbi:hypothetical protein E8D34_15335 [Nocardioides sp. GY 10113]|uniref:hypothetical protein n=1 Tax=Nocardioides sp. GY 10113 TaxID=2569761 RepID=UPI0010A89E99|nr:hypothetical protein [Nocardioides sp. GY 10113]TIC83922.1 hypothetical protein E8D34_15335 [Nocardioides sp. GY 10113]
MLRSRLRPRSAPLRVAAALAATVLVAAGCAAGGGGGASADDPGSGRGSGSGGAAGTSADGSGGAGLDSDAGELADLAEQLAQGEDGVVSGTGGQRGPSGKKSDADARVGSEVVIGSDISWPQCPRGMGIPEKRSQGMPMPLPDAEFVIVGLTNGPGFTPNPCLADQVDWVLDHRLLVAAYAVASYPDAATVDAYGDQGPFPAATKIGRLKNVGYQQARFNVGSMGAAGLQTPIVWIDVEPVPDFPWSADPIANAAVVEGLARGYADAGYEIGVYSTPSLWQGVVGDLSLGVPEWRAAGQTSAAEALSRCGADWSIQGGDAVLGQWVEDRRDRNLTCPGVESDLVTWFHQP